LKVALTFNVKPESETFLQELSPVQKNAQHQPEKAVDTYAEWDTWETINSIKNALALYNDVKLVEANELAFEKFKEIQPDIVFNFAEGLKNISREAQIPAMLDMLDIPYTGSDPLTLATCLDKARTKEILTYHGIPNSKFILADKIEKIKNHNLRFPLIVKPYSEGSGKGIFSTSYVKSDAELEREANRVISEYAQPALIEEFLPGREFTVAVLGNDDEAEVLPIVEINFSDFPEDFIPIYSYEAKWILDTKENPLDVFTCPAEISNDLEIQIKNTVLNAYKTLRCRDWSRIDVRLDSNNIPNIIEVNPIPGILPNPEDNSCFPKAARTVGLSYVDMVNKVLYVAAKRHKLL
jgi:D-alanine-D-alanine ligase